MRLALIPEMESCWFDQPHVGALGPSNEDSERILTLPTQQKRLHKTQLEKGGNWLMKQKERQKRSAFKEIDSVRDPV
jgi:hypothetical protein